MWILKQFLLCKQSSQFGRTLNVEKGKKRKRVLVCTELETPKQKTANVLVATVGMFDNVLFDNSKLIMFI
jgi:hypothetical protein